MQSHGRRDTSPIQTHGFARRSAGRPRATCHRIARKSRKFGNCRSCVLPGHIFKHGLFCYIYAEAAKLGNTGLPDNIHEHILTNTQHTGKHSQEYREAASFTFPTILAI